jgi:FAD/FMN-containing dehydrogenase
MRRRRLLVAAITVALQTLLPRIALRAAVKSSPSSRVRPSERGWPTAASWHDLKEAVGGSLIQVRPLFRACAQAPTSAACRAAIMNSRNPFYIGDQAGGTQVSGWLDAWRPAPSVYAVAARKPADVISAVKFARANNLRLVVKGGGHSYQGTSNAPDSLLIWTRAMNSVTLHDGFVPTGCDRKVTPQPAVTVEAGAMWIDAYDAVTTKAGRYVQGGGCTTVGVAGLVQSGGFGSFSKGFGTAASSLLQAEIVTAEGMLRTVNHCLEPELFWALKGGGGGSWGVITKLTLRTHSLPDLMGGAEGSIFAHSDAALLRLISRFLEFYSDQLLNPHWGEQIAIEGFNTLRISMVCQGLDNAQVAKIWQPFFDWVKAAADFTVTAELATGTGPARRWWDAVARKDRGNDSMISDPRAEASNTHAWWRGDQGQVGAFLYGFESAWLPSALLQPQQRTRLAEALFAASRHHPIELHFNKGLAGAPAEAVKAAADTATNPGVLDAFALAIIADGGAPAYPNLPKSSFDAPAGRKKANEIASAMSELLKIAPHAGSYVSESNYFERAWQQSYWGENYKRLRAAKEQYDPDGLFFVHHGVGSEDWSADGFTRLVKHEAP